MKWERVRDGIYSYRLDGREAAKVVDNEDGAWEWAIYDRGWTASCGIADTWREAIEAVETRLDGSYEPTEAEQGLIPIPDGYAEQ